MVLADRERFMVLDLNPEYWLGGGPAERHMRRCEVASIIALASRRAAELEAGATDREASCTQSSAAVRVEEAESGQ